MPSFVRLPVTIATTIPNPTPATIAARMIRNISPFPSRINYGMNDPIRILFLIEINCYSKKVVQTKFLVCTTLFIWLLFLIDPFVAIL